MDCYLVGYPNSQRLIKASRYLAHKYLPFNIVYLNYEGSVQHWAAFLAGYFSSLNEEQIIFALDDYLVADYLDVNLFAAARIEVFGDIVCAKLCHSTEQEHREYPVTTQYSIWDRKYLISLLLKVSSPWSFEIDGSRIFDKVCIHRPCLEYFTNSAISLKWEGIRLDGLKQEDIDYIHQNGLINEQANNDFRR